MTKIPFAFALPPGLDLDVIMPRDGIYTKSQRDTYRVRAPRPPRVRPSKNTKRTSERTSDKSSLMNNIAVFDTETNPFNSETRERIIPFLGVIYADEFPPIVIWNNDFDAWLIEVADAFASLPVPYTVYAHNGGKFDYHFLLSKLTGKIQFRGSGIMKARLGKHELRDSLHIIPVKLAAISKEEIDYSLFEPHLRDEHRDEIIRYCISDCANLLPVIKAFRAEFGNALTIGGAASTEVARHYDVKTFGEVTDAYFRKFYFGGRVELLAGKGTFKGPYKLYDINSAYPDAMANLLHPISSTFTVYNDRAAIRPNTTFIELTCTNRGALVAFDPETVTLTTRVPHGHFFTTIHEYRTALELGLISDITLHRTIDFHEHSNFADFVLPRYNERAILKDLLAENPDDKTLQRKSLFIKLILNNAYGRWAINPRNFKDMELCLPGDAPTQSDMTRHLINPEYTIWARPAIRQRFGNVATAASITGGTRATLMRGIHNAVKPIYCDTDSLICLELNNTELHPSKLGAWSLEAEYDEVHIAAKKTYAAKNTPSGVTKVRAKGTNSLTFEDIAEIVDGKALSKWLNSPTFKADGTQRYIKRTVRAT